MWSRGAAAGSLTCHLEWSLNKQASESFLHAYSSYSVATRDLVAISKHAPPLPSTSRPAILFPQITERLAKVSKLDLVASEKPIPCWASYAQYGKKPQRDSAMSTCLGTCCTSFPKESGGGEHPRPHDLGTRKVTDYSSASCTSRHPAGSKRNS